MNATGTKVEVTANLALSARELQLLNHIFSYNNSVTFQGMVSSSYADGVSLKELEEFGMTIRDETDKLLQLIQKGKIIIVKGEEYLVQPQPAKP